MKKNKKKAKKRYNLGGLQQFQQPQQQSLVDSQGEQQANALVNGVSSVNPIVGGFMKLGQGIGAQTVNDDGLYKSRGAGVLDNSVNPTTGITNFKDLSKDFNASTLANQLTAGVVGRSATQTRRKKELANKLNQEQAVLKQGMIQNSGNTFMAKGGKLSKKLKVVQGGSLNQISPDAVEVNANNPALTDSVELQEAFVDNNEIIDNQNRVFSDVLTTPKGRTVAKEAKRLEKMKSSSSRFNDSNTRIDSKLDELFNYQEQIKRDATMTDNSVLKYKASDRFDERRDRTGAPEDLKMLDKLISDERRDLVRSKNVAIKGLFNKDNYSNGGKMKKRKLGMDDGGFITDPKPKFKNKQEHDNYYIQQRLGSMQTEYPQLYDRYNEMMAVGNKADALTAVMAGGGIPVFEPDPIVNTPANPTNWAKLGFKAPKTEGYRYDKNRPDKEAITNIKLSKGGYVKSKPAYTKGGPFAGYDPNQVREDGFADMNPNNSFLNDINWGKVGNTAATFAPNITNAILQKKLKGPKSPMLETDLRLDRVSPDAQLAEASRQANMAIKLITSNTAQGANLSSSVGSILAKRLGATNQIYGQNQAINAQIQGNEAQLNQGIRSRNTERTNRFRDNQVDFTNKKLQMTSENVANLSGKIQSQSRERNLLNLDKDKFAIIQARFDDLPAEMRAKYPSVFDYYNDTQKGTNKLGGMITKKKPYINGGKMRYC